MEQKILNGQYHIIVREVASLTKEGWNIKDGNTIFLIGGSLRVVMEKESTVDETAEEVGNEEPTEESTEPKPKTTGTRTRKPKTKAD